MNRAAVLAAILLLTAGAVQAQAQGPGQARLGSVTLSTASGRIINQTNQPLWTETLAGGRQCLGGGVDSTTVAPNAAIPFQFKIEGLGDCFNKPSKGFQAFVIAGRRYEVGFATLPDGVMAVDSVNDGVVKIEPANKGALANTWDWEVTCIACAPPK